MPLPVRFLFAEAEKRLPQHSHQLRPTGLLPMALLGCLCRGLEDGEVLERLAAQPLERGAKERLALLSECLQASVGQQQQRGGVPKPAAHAVLRGLEERRPKWISLQLHKARKLCCKRLVSGQVNTIPFSKSHYMEWLVRGIANISDTLFMSFSFCNVYIFGGCRHCKH